MDVVAIENAGYSRKGDLVDKESGKLKLSIKVTNTIVQACQTGRGTPVGNHWFKVKKRLCAPQFVE